MSAISTPTKKLSNTKSLVLVDEILTAIGILFFVYLMWYVSRKVIDLVKVVAVTSFEGGE